MQIAWISLIPFGIIILSGGIWLKPVPTIYWGGITLTLFISFCSGVIALPLGIILALGRQSNLLIIRNVCSFYIDFMRSLPLIAVLFFGQLLVPLFLPVEIELNRVVRAIIAFAIFAAAYIAEDVRGGIQSIPTNQLEAGEVLGLSRPQIYLLIVLPQALRVALPALTNQAVGLLQNTSLMAILGLVELLGISRSLLANPEFIGRYMEVYVWLGICYWTMCTLISVISKQLESNLNPDKL
ncbi:amino acid ABC transporter permease [Prochlorococcus sp. MIT 1341]|uniref:amino acid ABC transporter permease n=1 Tax=Prochlorococcus sp. MIT 1341 TaxID=3096221 RepID=UPI002A75D69D|nr:amino acid ABC transporter permease [Prochlorococcus sp. MIT 1341]